MLRPQAGFCCSSSQVASPSVIQRGQRLCERPRWITCVNSWKAVRAQEKFPRICDSGDTAVTTGPKQTPSAGNPSKPVERTEKSSKVRKTSMRTGPVVNP